MGINHQEQRVKSPKVHLYIRVLTAAGGSVFAEPVWNKNRTLRAGYAEVDSKHHPEGIYYLRFRRGGESVWEAVGPEPDAAIVALRRTEHTLQATSLGLEVVNPTASPQSATISAGTSLAEAIREYLIDLKRFSAPGTLKGATHMLTRFGARFPGRSVDEINRKDLLDHIDSLKSDGLGDTTISNHLIRIGALLRVHGVVGLLNATDKPKAEEKEVEAYEAEELEIFFTAADPQERMIFQFFLGTGLREREVMFVSWRNIDFKNCWVKVRSKPEMGFKIKDKQERSVPVPDALMAALAERRKCSSSMLVFPGR
jgi:integrase/recombinase XerD